MYARQRPKTAATIPGPGGEGKTAFGHGFERAPPTAYVFVRNLMLQPRALVSLDAISLPSIRAFTAASR